MRHTASTPRPYRASHPRVRIRLSAQIAAMTGAKDNMVDAAKKKTEDLDKKTTRQRRKSRDLGERNA